MKHEIGRLVIAEAVGSMSHPGAITSAKYHACLSFSKAVQLGKDLVLEKAVLETLDELNPEQAYDIARIIAERFYNNTLDMLGAYEMAQLADVERPCSTSAFSTVLTQAYLERDTENAKRAEQGRIDGL